MDNSPKRFCYFNNKVFYDEQICSVNSSKKTIYRIEKKSCWKKNPYIYNS